MFLSPWKLRVRVALWFILRGDLFYVLPWVILFLCFSVLSALPRLGKRELILVLFVHLFNLCLFRFVGFLFLLVNWGHIDIARLWIDRAILIVIGNVIRSYLEHVRSDRCNAPTCTSSKNHTFTKWIFGHGIWSRRDKSVLYQLQILRSWQWTHVINILFYILNSTWPLAETIRTVLKQKEIWNNEPPIRTPHPLTHPPPQKKKKKINK